MHKKYWFWLSVLYISVSLVCSYLGLFGHWRINILGIEHQAIWDPGGAYIASGVTLFDQRYPSFIGHPGTTLMLLIYILAKIFHGLYIVFGSSVPYEAFLVKNIFYFILWLKVFITILHLISFYVIYLLSLKITRNTVISCLAVATYATSYPLLFYLNNISPEPLLVIFTLMSVYFCWLHFENRAIGENRRSYKYVILAALSSVLAFYTKMTIAALIVPFTFAYILLGTTVREENKKNKFRNNLAAAGVFAVTAVVFTVIIGYKLDWNNFTKFWFNYAPGSPLYDNQVNWYTNLIDKFSYLGAHLIKTVRPYVQYKYWENALTARSGLFIKSEILFVVISIAGFISFWKVYKEQHREIIWLLALLCVISPSIILKGISGWHYLFIHLAVFSVFYAYAIYFFALKTVNGKAGRAKMISIAIISIIHSASILFFYQAKKNDIKEYAKNWKPYYNALKEINYHEKIAINNAYPGILVDVSGRILNFTRENSVFHKEFNSYFVLYDDSISEKEAKEQNIRVNVNRDSKGNIVVIKYPK